MRLWGALYGLVWLVLGEFLLGTWPNAPLAVGYLHIVLGLGVVLLTYENFVGLRRTRVPDRVKRIARVTFAFSIVMVATGGLLEGGVGAGVSLLGASVYQALLAFHVVIALATITQAAAVAIAYDMWEDHEFEKESQPGQIAGPSPG
jgi:hypothetical protein